MICDKCGEKIDKGQLIRGHGLLCNMCLAWLNVKIKKRNILAPDWNVKTEFLQNLLILLGGKNA